MFEWEEGQNFGSYIASCNAILKSITITLARLTSQTFLPGTLLDFGWITNDYYKRLGY